MEGRGEPPSPSPWEESSDPVERWVPRPTDPDAGEPSPAGPESTSTPEPAQEARRFNWFGADPQARRGRMPFDSSRGMHWVAAIVMGAVVFFFALEIIGGAVLFFVGEPVDATVTPALIWLNGALLIVGLGLPALLWVAAFYRDSVKAWAHGLFLRSHRPVVHVLLGVAGAVGMLLLAVVVSLLLSLVGYEPENPLVDDLQGFITWPLVVWIALSAALAEELFFRGLLQPRIGIVASAVLFGFVHISYGVPLQILMPLAFGFLLSTLVISTRSLLPAVVAHFFYNFAVGAALILERDFSDLDVGMILYALLF